jgi:type IV pilus assembly protein PilX
MSKLQRKSPSMRGRQAGISLLVVLILLVVTSILGVAVLRSSAMQERMSANMYDRSLAMQAAEVGLKTAEDTLALPANDKFKDTTYTPTATDCTTLGICNTYTKQAAATWMTGPVLGYGDSSVPDTSSKYWIEYLGVNQSHMETGGTIPTSESVARGPMFRITSRSQSDGRADVALQTDVIYRFPRL